MYNQEIKAYQFIMKVEKHSKKDIYDFFKLYEMTGSVTSNTDGNLVIEIQGPLDRITICKNGMSEFFKGEKLINVNRIENLTYKGSSFLIG